MNGREMVEEHPSELAAWQRRNGCGAIGISESEG
jgi:hypothetical protein